MTLPSLTSLVRPILWGGAFPEAWRPYEDSHEAFSRAWEGTEEGSAMMGAFSLTEPDLRPLLRAALGCARLASSHELAMPGLQFPIVGALDAIDAWLEAPDDARAAQLAQYAKDATYWVQRVAGSSSAHAVTDAVQLAHGVANRHLRQVPILASQVVVNAADAMVEDALRADGSPDDNRAVEARLMAHALGFLTQMVRELVPCPRTTAAELRERARLGHWSPS